MIMSIIRSSAKPTTTRNYNLGVRCIISSKEKKKKERKKKESSLPPMPAVPP